MRLKVFQANEYNVGDQLPTPIVKHFLKVKVKVVGKKSKGKLMVIGSECHRAKKGDVIWGQGIRRTWVKTLEGVTVLAVRGKLVHKYIDGVVIPPVYGDPALLMPLIYNPRVKKVHELGVVPHFADARNDTYPKDGHVIHVSLPWREFIKELCSCKHIVSSSLHGIVLAEAYGIPATWAVWGGTEQWRIKYLDYLTGTGRDIQEPGELPPIKNLERIQRRLVKALLGHYGEYVRKR